ncbi:helix-turn-helix transcriptional regulator [Micromonospora sp. SCSIO 07396]
MLARTVAELLPALQELLHARVLEAQGDFLEFRQESMRRAVAASIPPPVLAEVRRELLAAGARAEASARPGASTETSAQPRGPVVERAALQLVTSAPASDCWTVLNARERDVAHLANQGLTNRQIAIHLHLSPHTVNYYLRRIYRRLNINSRIQLAAYANARAS